MPSAAAMGQRFKFWALFVGFLVGGVVAIWLSLAGLVAAGRALATRAQLLVLSPADARALFAGIALLVFAVMLLLPVPDWAKGGPRRRKRRAECVRVDWAAVLMGIALLCVLLCVVAPTIVAVAMGEAAAQQGYRLCPSPDDERRPPMRWSRTDPAGLLQHCPRSRREALEQDGAVRR